MKDITGKLKYIFDKKQWRSMLLLLAGVFIGAVFELFGVSLFMPLIKVISTPQKVKENPFMSRFIEALSLDSTTKMFIALAVVIILIYVIKNVYLCFLYYFLYSFIYKNQLVISTRLIRCYLKKPYSYHLDTNTSDMVRNIMLDTERLFQLILQFMNLMAEALLSLLLITYLLLSDPVMTISIACILIVFMGGYMLLTRKRVKRYGEINQNYDGRMHQAIEEALGAVKDIKILHREEYFVNRFNYCGNQKMRALINMNFFGAVPKYIIEMVCVVGILLVMIFKALSGTDMNTMIPQLAAFAVAAFKMLPSVGKISNYLNGISFLTPSIDLIYNDLKETEDMLRLEYKDESDAPDTSGAEQLKIENITFAYSGTGKNVLEDVSFSIPVGSSVGFIGATGSGKSTMADVILGILYPAKGTIRFGDMNVYEYPFTWAEKLAYIPQVIFLADESIRENIAFGIDRDKIDDDKVWAAVREAQLTDFIKSLPEGLDTKVGERGVRLSGGQRQRIGIARALYGDPELLVLDEATSALDNETEKAVMDAIDSLHGRKTMIIIAHRLTTIKNCDVIYRVAQGKIKPVGRSEFEAMLEAQTADE